jgi:phage gpG-like protein
MTGSVEVRGATTLAATMRLAALDLGDLGDAAQSGVAHVAQSARAKAPRRTGRLAGSISVHSSRNEAEASSGLVYAGRTHYGWPAVRQAAQPFLTDALAQSEKTIVDGYMASVLRALSKVRGV